MVDDWPDWLTADSATAVAGIEARYAVVQAEMDGWEARFLAAIESRLLTNPGRLEILES